MREETRQLGVLNLVIEPEQRCVFRANPARSLRAALLRRLELVDPDLSSGLHAPDEGAGALRPWTVSPLMGPLVIQAGALVAELGTVYRVRLTALTPAILAALDATFLSDHPLAREPLVLEHVPFQVGVEQTGWQGLTTYPALLTYARPQQNIILAFNSPTGFRRRDDRFLAPEPRLCLAGYLRKWNSFADVSLPEEELLAYAQDHMALRRDRSSLAKMEFGDYAIPGVTGEVEWVAEGGSPALLRLVNALVDYATYCGTGIQTAQGMGQTERLGPNAPGAAGES